MTCRGKDPETVREYERAYRAMVKMDKDRYSKVCESRNAYARQRYAQRKRALETCERLSEAFSTYAGGDPFFFLCSLAGAKPRYGDWKALFDALAEEVRP